MKEKVEPWHELVFICLECGREFQTKAMSLSATLCPQCVIKKRIEAVVHWEALETAA